MLDTTIRQYFEAEGEGRFRDLETQGLAGVVAEPGGMALSTGGGTVLRPENRETLRKFGTVLYLRASPEDFYRRVRHDRTRPWLQVANPGLLRKHRVARVVADTGGRWPEVGDVTADFLYLRLPGARQLYAAGYSDAQIKAWAGRIRAWAPGGDAGLPRRSEAPAAKRAQRDVFCFFDNTMKLHAPDNALRLSRELGRDPATLAIGSQIRCVSSPAGA